MAICGCAWLECHYVEDNEGEKTHANCEDEELGGEDSKVAEDGTEKGTVRTSHGGYWSVGLARDSSRKAMIWVVGA